MAKNVSKLFLNQPLGVVYPGTLFGVSIATRLSLVTRNLSSSSPKEQTEEFQRSYYRYFLPIQTRWSDNDQYGHVNNMVYYSYFDSIINHYLIKYGGLNTNIKTSDIIGYMVHTECTFKKPMSFPDVVLAGLVISHVGKSSVKYSVALFAQKESSNQNPPCGGHFDEKIFKSFESTAAAVGKCVHVFVNTETNRPVSLPTHLSESLKKISTSNTSSKL